MMATTQPASFELWRTRAFELVPPWRIAAFLILLVLVIWRLLPWLARLLGKLTMVAAEPVAGVLLLPEYVLSNWRRGHGRPPLAGAYLYGAALDVAVKGTHGAAAAFTGKVGKPRKIPWRRVLVVALLPAVLWYGNQYLPKNEPMRPVAALLQSAQTPLLATDAWIAERSGVAPYKTPVNTDPAAACKPTPKPKKKR